MVLEVLADGGRVDGALHAQSPAERPPALREVQARQRGVHPGTSPREPGTGVRDDGHEAHDPVRDDAQQPRPVTPLAAAHAGPLRLAGSRERG